MVKMTFPPCPEGLKAIAHYLKIAEEHENRDIVITYWCRLHALEVAMKITKSTAPEISNMLLTLMDWLETIKKEHAENEAITSKVCAQATIENYVLKLFKYADEQDRAENWGKNVVKAFYTAGILMDVLTSFGPLSEDIQDKRKYAKWKAAYIHNCLKVGERPVPGPIGSEEDEFKLVDPPPDSKDLGMFKPVLGTIERPISFPEPPMDTEPETSTAWVPPVVPAQPQISSPVTPVAPLIGVAGTASLTPEQLQKAQKYCKWASSALNYDDAKNAIENLQKALHLLQTGNEMPN